MLELLIKVVVIFVYVDKVLEIIGDNVKQVSATQIIVFYLLTVVIPVYVLWRLNFGIRNH